MASAKKQNTPLQDTVATLKGKALQLNEELLMTSDEWIEGSVATGEKVQDLMEKVLKSGTTLLGKQQELALHTIETLIGQYKTGNEKFRKLLGLDKYQARKAKAKRAIKKTKNKKSVRVNAKTTTSIDANLVEVIKKDAVATKKASTKKSRKKTTTKVDLTKINGIGPKIAALLYKSGIKTYEQLAETKVETLKEILTKAGKRYASYDPTTWAQQAELAAAGKWEVLKVWMDRVKAGKSKGNRKITLL